MAKNEDLSMDEILSSIRNILMEDGVEHGDNKQEQQSSEDDILDLSAAQIVEDEVQAVQPEEKTSVTDESSDAPVPLPEIKDKDIDEVGNGVEDVEIDLEAEPIYSSEDDKTKPDFNAEPIYQEDDEFIEHSDVSEKLLDNFAQMFAKKDEDSIPQKPVSIEPASIKASSSQSLETIIAAEISKQVKSWLDANLPVIAQDLVKQELVRVMARAGK